MMKRCRFLSVLLVVVMAIGMVPSAAFAADTDTSAEETAEIVGSTPGAVRVAQHRALSQLRKAVSSQRAERA